MCEVLNQSYLENKGRLTDMTLLPQKPSLVQQQSPLPTLHKMNCLNLEQLSATSLFGQIACSCTRAVYCAHYHSSVHLSQGQSEQRLPKSSTLWLSSSAGRGSHCPSTKGLLWIASEIIRFFFAKHSTIELVGYYNGESKWTLTHFWGSELHSCEKATKITPAFTGLWVKLSGKEDFRQTHGGGGGVIWDQQYPITPIRSLPKSIFITLGSQKSVGESQRWHRNAVTGLGGLLHQTPPLVLSEASGQSKKENRMFLQQGTRRNLVTVSLYVLVFWMISRPLITASIKGPITAFISVELTNHPRPDSRLGKYLSAANRNTGLCEGGPMTTVRSTLMTLYSCTPVDI